MSQNIERVKLKGAPACVVVRAKRQRDVAVDAAGVESVVES